MLKSGNILGTDFYSERDKFEQVARAGSVKGYKDMLVQLEQAHNEYITNQHNNDIAGATEVAQGMYDAFKDDLQNRVLDYEEFNNKRRNLEKQALVAQITDYHKWDNEVVKQYQVANKKRKDDYVKASEDAAEKSSDVITKSFEDQVISFKSSYYQNRYS